MLPLDDLAGISKAIPRPSQGHWSVNLWATPNRLLRMKAGPKACARHVLACGMFEKDGANQRRFQRICSRSVRATGLENIWKLSVQDEAKTLQKQMKCCHFLDFVRGTAWVAFKLAIFGMAKGHVARRAFLECLAAAWPKRKQRRNFELAGPCPHFFNEKSAVGTQGFGHNERYMQPRGR